MNITEVSEVTEKILNVYKKNIYKKLRKYSEKIFNYTKEQLEEECRNDERIFANSVYSELYPFSIIYREKKPVSLGEKIIRNELFQNINSENEEEIEDNILYEMDDLIAMTILVDTSKSLNYFANLFFDNKLENFKILNDYSDSEKSIGELKYFNIKTRYIDENIDIKVEIQVKSTITYSFTNLQHKLIYKNNKVTMTKKHSDFMIKAVTPAINAIESVIDIAENSSINFEEEAEEYERTLKIEELINYHFDEDIQLASYTNKLDGVVARAYGGYTLRHGNMKLADFWKEYRVKDTSSKYDFEKASFKIQILDRILDISESFIENIFINDYIFHKSKNPKIFLSIAREDFKKFNQIDSLIPDHKLSYHLINDNKYEVINSFMTSLDYSQELVEKYEDNLSSILEAEDLKAITFFFLQKSINDIYKFDQDFSKEILMEDILGNDNITSIISLMFDDYKEKYTNEIAKNK